MLNKHYNKASVEDLSDSDNGASDCEDRACKALGVVKNASDL